MLDSLTETVDRCYEHLADGTIDAWGKELDQAWQVKKQLAGGISNPCIDEMYEKAKQAGAAGGKILGAGGGGFLLLYVHKEQQQAVRSVLKGYREVSFQFEPEGSRIIFAD